MYKIYCDRELIYHRHIEELKITSAVVELIQNGIGTFDFTIHPNNPHFNSIKKKKSIIKVYDDDFLLFKGIALDDALDFSNNKKVKCKDEYYFLTYSMQRPYEFTGTPKDLFEMFVNNHNEQVEKEHQFKIGYVTVTDPNDYIVRSNTNYENTWNSIQTKLINTLGGYLRIRHEGADTYIDYLQDFDTTNSQKVEFGENLLDVQRENSTLDIATVLIPLGAKPEDSDERITIASVNNGIDYIANAEAVERYGRIYATNIWDDVTEPKNLLTKANEYLENLSYQINSITIRAVDLSKIKKSINEFRMHNYIDVVSKYHNINDSFLPLKMTINLFMPQSNKIELNVIKSSLTDEQIKQSNVVNTFVESLNQVISNGSVSANKINGLINLFKTQLHAQRTDAQKQNVRAILFEDLDPNSPTYGATCYGTAGLEFTTTRNETDTDWVWGNAFGPYGLIANAIVTGLLSDKLGNFYLDMDTGELRMKNGTFTGKIEGSEFIVTKERTIDITDDDITAIENYLTNGTALTDEQMDKFDINQDGRVDHLDYSLAEMIRNGEISTKFTDTITIYNDGTSKIRLRTLNGNGAFRLETVISTGTVDTRYIYADNIYTDVLNVNAWIKYGDEKMIGLGGRGTEREHLQVWFPNLPLDIWTKKILFRGESLFISAGDTWQSGYYNAHGRITHNQSRIEFSIPVNKRIDSYSLICTSLKMKLRTVDGNFIGEGDVSYDYCTNSDYTISCYPNPNTRTIRVLVDKNIGYDTKANTPIDVEIIDSTFEFN